MKIVLMVAFSLLVFGAGGVCGIELAWSAYKKTHISRVACVENNIKVWNEAWKQANQFMAERCATNQRTPIVIEPPEIPSLQEIFDQQQQRQLNQEIFEFFRKQNQPTTPNFQSDFKFPSPAPVPPLK